MFCGKCGKENVARERFLPRAKIAGPLEPKEREYHHERLPE